MNETILRKTYKDDIMNNYDPHDDYRDYQKTNIIHDDKGLYLQSYSKNRSNNNNSI